jgi:putative flippase GtrA
MTRKLFASQLARYILAGGLSYFIELSFLLLLHKSGGLSVEAATAIAFWVGLASAFLLQKLFAFQDYQRGVRTISRQMTGFSLLVLFNYIFTLLVVYAIPADKIILSRTLALVVTTIWNYFLYKRLIFGNKGGSLQLNIESWIRRNLQKTQRFAQQMTALMQKDSSLKILAIVSLFVLLLASVFAGTKATQVQSITSDQFIITYNYSDIGRGQATTAIEHTNVLKLPILWLLGRVSFNFTTLVIVNVAFIYASFLLWIYLVYRLLGQRSIAIMSLTFSAVLINSPLFSLNITQVSIRHIEYPLALLFIFGIYRLIHKRQKYLYFLAGLSAMLALLLLNDRLTLYTLVPASFFSILFLAYQEKIQTSQTLKALAAISAGTVFGLALPKVLTRLGVLDVVSGYSGVLHFINFDRIPGAIWLSLQQSLDLFGGLIFGQTVRLSRLGIFLCAIIFGAAVYGILMARRQIHNKKMGLQGFIYTNLVFLILFCYLGYIIPDLVNSGNARYLTLIVYIGVTFFAWLILMLADKRKWIYPLVCAALLFTAVVGFLHSYRLFNNSINASSALRESTIKAAESLKKEGVRVVGSSGGYQALRFWSNHNINAVFEAQGDCKTPVSWINNTSWLKPKHEQKTAFLVDVHSPGHGPFQDSTPCTSDEVVAVYGKPAEILKEEKSIYHPQSPYYIYIYNYDIRTRLSQ